MAEDIAGICREHVQKHIGDVKGLSEGDAVEILARGARQQLDKAGWGNSDADYGVDVTEIVKEELGKHHS